LISRSNEGIFFYFNACRWLEYCQKVPAHLHFVAY